MNLFDDWEERKRRALEEDWDTFGAPVLRDAPEMQGGSAKSFAQPNPSIEFSESWEDLSRVEPQQFAPPTFETRAEPLPAPIMPPDPGGIRGFLGDLGQGVSDVGRFILSNSELRPGPGGDGYTGTSNILPPMQDLYSTDVPYYSDFARDTLRPLAGDIGGAAFNRSPYAGAGVIADLIRDKPLGTSGQQFGSLAAEAQVPISAGDVALTLAPLIGPARNLMRGRSILPFPMGNIDDVADISWLGRLKAEESQLGRQLTELEAQNIVRGMGSASNTRALKPGESWRGLLEEVYANNDATSLMQKAGANLPDVEWEAQRRALRDSLLSKPEDSGLMDQLRESVRRLQAGETTADLAQAARPIQPGPGVDDTINTIRGGVTREGAEALGMSPSQPLQPGRTARARAVSRAAEREAAGVATSRGAIWTGNEPPVQEGFTRLYRGEEPYTLSSGQVYKPRAADFTADLNVANRYKGQGHIRYVDIPSEELATSWQANTLYPDLKGYMGPEAYDQLPVEVELPPSLQRIRERINQPPPPPEPPRIPPGGEPEFFPPDPGQRRVAPNRGPGMGGTPPREPPPPPPPTGGSPSGMEPLPGRRETLQSLAVQQGQQPPLMPELAQGPVPLRVPVWADDLPSEQPFGWTPREVPRTPSQPIRQGPQLPDQLGLGYMPERFPGGEQPPLQQLGAQVQGPTVTPVAAPPRQVFGNVERPSRPPEAPDAWDWVSDTIALPMTTKSVLSPPLLRQGLMRLVTHPVAAARELGLSFKGAFSEDVARSIQRSIDENPLISPSGVRVEGLEGLRETPFKVVTGQQWDQTAGRYIPVEQSLDGRSMGLFMRDWGPLASREARDVSYQGLSSQTPISRITSRILAPSERQAALELNLNAGNWYAEQAQAMWNSGNRNVADYQRLARNINHRMHYGSLGQGRIPFFFSLRAVSGRAESILDSVNALAHANRALQPGAEREVLKSLAGSAIGIGGLIGAASQVPGVEVITDNGLPTLKYGPHRFDPWAGWNPQARLLQKVANSVLEGKSLDETVQAVGSEANQFGRSQLGPLPGVVTSYATGKDYKGDPASLEKDLASGEFFAHAFAPFNIEGIYEAFKAGMADPALSGGKPSASQGIIGALLTGVPGTFSMSVNSYRTPSERKEMIQDAVASEKFGGLPYAELTKAQRNTVNLDERVGGSQVAALEARAARGDILAINQLQDRAERFNAEFGAGGARSIDIQLATGSMTGPEARAIYDQLEESLAIKSQGRYSLDMAQDRIKEIPQEELSIPDRARQDYFDTVLGPSSTQTGMDFNRYQFALDEWQTRWPQYSKEDVAPSKSLSPTHAELQQARRDLRPYFDASDKAYEVAKIIASASPEGSPERLVLKFNNGNELRDAIGDALGTTVNLTQRDAVVASVVDDLIGLSSMEQAARAEFIANNPRLIFALEKWYGAPGYLWEAAEEAAGVK